MLQFTFAMRGERPDLVLLTPNHLAAILAVEVWVALAHPRCPPILNGLGTTRAIFVVGIWTLVLHLLVFARELRRIHFLQNSVYS